MNSTDTQEKGFLVFTGHQSDIIGNWGAPQLLQGKAYHFLLKQKGADFNTGKGLEGTLGHLHLMISQEPPPRVTPKMNYFVPEKALQAEAPTFQEAQALNSTLASSTAMSNP